jgi:hypothetical protein
MRSNSGSAGAEGRPGPLAVAAGVMVWAGVAVLGPDLVALGPSRVFAVETPLACWLAAPQQVDADAVAADPEAWRLWPRIGARRAGELARGERSPSAREAARWRRLHADAQATGATDPSRSRAPPCR